jgi:hypothetical protein
MPFLMGGIEGCCPVLATSTFAVSCELRNAIGDQSAVLRPRQPHICFPHCSAAKQLPAQCLLEDSIQVGGMMQVAISRRQEHELEQYSRSPPRRGVGKC